MVLRIATDAGLARPLIDGLPYLRAEVVFAARYEMAQTVDDVLSRRTRGSPVGSPRKHRRGR